MSNEDKDRLKGNHVFSKHGFASNGTTTVSRGFAESKSTKKKKKMYALCMSAQLVGDANVVWHPVDDASVVWAGPPPASTRLVKNIYHVKSSKRHPYRVVFAGKDNVSVCSG
jgi:hypothetical protein